MSILTQLFLALVGSDLMSFTFSSAGHLVSLLSVSPYLIMTAGPIKVKGRGLKRRQTGGTGSCNGSKRIVL